jgi:hypothetical protein
MTSPRRYRGAKSLGGRDQANPVVYATHHPMTTTPDKPKRRWCQFRLRTLFLLVAVCAVPCGLFKWKWDRKQAERRAVTEIKKVGGFVAYDWQVTEGYSASAVTLLRLKQAQRREPPGPAVLRKFLGDDFLAHLVQVQFPYAEITDDELVWMKALPDLEYLDLRNKKGITDNGLEHLQSLSRLHWLVLNQTKLTGAGLRHLKLAKGLRLLGLQSLPITDADLVQLAAFPDLEELNLSHTQITDAGLTHLAHLPKLRSVWLMSTAISNEGVKLLAKRSKLSLLGLSRTNTDDEALRMIGRMTTLTELRVGGPTITNEGLKHLQNLTNLDRLSIDTSPAIPDDLKNGLKRGPSGFTFRESSG